MTSFNKFALIALTLVTAAGGITAARAQGNYLPSPFVPWLAGQGYERDDEQPRTDATAQKQKAKNPLYPDAAVITPEHTRALIEKLERGEPVIVPPSPLEESYATRIVDRLPQFGYEMFAAPEEPALNETPRPGLPVGGVQDDYILSIGDKLSITLRGQRQSKNLYQVDNAGLLTVEDLPPLSAAGRSLSQVRAALEEEAQRLYNTDVFVALDQVRQIDVLVVGHVGKPGRRTLTVFDTVLDALNDSGGIEKTGSLRQIRLVRGGRSTIIDLYGLLISGSANMDLALQDGDKLIVPPIGPVIAVAGGVRRPAIYEILPQVKGMLHEPDRRSRKISLEDALEMAGGVMTPGQNRFMKFSLTADGQETVSEVEKPFEPLFGDGSILMVAPSREARAGTVELAGHTRRPGIHDIDRVPALSDLLSDDKVFGPDIYPLIGVIERWDNDQMTRQMLSFPPLLVLKGQFDRTLEDGDVVHLFSRAQIIALQKQAGAEPDPEDIEPAAGSAAERPEMIDDPVMASFLKERSAFIRGAVRQEGAWPVAEGASLENIVAVAGGLALEASTKNIEVTAARAVNADPQDGSGGTRRTMIDYTVDDPAAVMLEPGDTVRVNQKFHKVADNSVQIVGEVARPGRYDLMPGDKLSDLLERAGGVTPQAYPDGAIFSRDSERRAEESRFRAAARDLDQALAAAMDDKDKAPDAGQIALARDLAAELRQVQAVGRITVEADPGVLASQPELDLFLEAGDKIFVPKRPMTVRVNGEILSPAALQFRKDRDARDYIAQAGGYTYNADKDRVFVLYPDGSAQPLQIDAWNHTAVMIPPGSTIVVPRDPKPFNFIDSARDLTQILSNLAITGIFLDDLRDN